MLYCNHGSNLVRKQITYSVLLFRKIVYFPKTFEEGSSENMTIRGCPPTGTLANCCNPWRNLAAGVQFSSSLITGEINSCMESIEARVEHGLA